MIKNKRWIEGIAFIVVLLAAGLILGGCAPPATSTPEAIPTVLLPTSNNPIVIDIEAKEIRIAARVQAKYYNEPTWHGVVWKDGKAGKRAIFQAYISDRVFHEALVFLGAEPADNLKLPGYPEIKDPGKLWGDYQKIPEYAGQYVQGPELEVFVTWKGAPRTYRLEEVLNDPEGEKGKGVEVRFGGNYDYIEIFGSGCLTCLYSCPGGKTSNARYNAADFARHKEAGVAGFTGKKEILPPDGTDVVITYRLK